jgi:uncharacterized protein
MKKDPSVGPFPSHTPLSKQELLRLRAFLTSIQNAQSMNLEQLDGFFAALVCSPRLVPPSEYMPQIWGRNPSKKSVFRSLPEAEEILGLIMRHWNTIASTLFAGQTHQPCLVKDEEGLLTGNDWATGFTRGMGFDRKSWAELLSDEENAGSVIPILMLAHEHDPDSEMRPPSIVPEKRQDLLRRIPESVLLLYRYFEPYRKAKTRSAAN